jgi:hypothetical protein
VSSTCTGEAVAGGRGAAGPGLQSRALPEDVQLLERAAELVADGWCQRALAQDRDGRQVEPWSESARSWSPLGALLTAWYEGRGVSRDAFKAAYASLALATGGRLEEWNAARWRTERHVCAAFFRAQEYLPVARRQVRGRAGGRSPSPTAWKAPI